MSRTPISKQWKTSPNSNWAKDYKCSEVRIVRLPYNAWFFYKKSVRLLYPRIFVWQLRLRQSRSHSEQTDYQGFLKACKIKGWSPNLQSFRINKEIEMLCIILFSHRIRSLSRFSGRNLARPHEQCCHQMKTASLWLLKLLVVWETSLQVCRVQLLQGDRLNFPDTCSMLTVFEFWI